MSNHSQASDSARLLTVEGILVEHEQLLAAQADREDAQQIRGFVDRLEASGAYFDEASERKAIQGTLDYWTSELAKYPADQDSTGQRRRSICDFDADALQALQRDFQNPFGGIADRTLSLTPGQRHSPAAILRLIDDAAKPQGLRFQEGLLKEMVSQVTGDSERDDPTQAVRDRDDAGLLEFCLWHLFEDPETRLGNKVYRPRRSGHKDERVEYFSCKVYLVRKTDQLFEALGRPAAVLDALMRMGGGDTRMHGAESFFGAIAGHFVDLGQALRTWLRSGHLGAGSYELYGSKSLTLLEFLQASRLAFAERGRWRIVHPALVRWDPLKERRWKAAQREKLLSLSSTVLLVALGTSLVWIAWYEYWTGLAATQLATAQTSTDVDKRLIESVAGLRASRLSMGSEDSYASQVGNDAIGAVIAERARLGKGAIDDLPPYPNLPHLECEKIQGSGTAFRYAVKVANVAAKLSLNVCPVFAVNLNGTRLAAAWEKAGRVTLRVFEIQPNFQLGSGENGALREDDLNAETQTVPWMQNAMELELEPSLNRKSTQLKGECIDRALRFSEDDRTVSFECLYSVDKQTSAVQWIHAMIRGKGAPPDAASLAAIARAEMVVADTSNELKPCKGSEELPRTSRAKSVFLGRLTESGSGFATVREDGFVQIWHDGKQRPCLSTQFRSDFVRVATGGRPAALAVNDVPRPTYAVYALDPINPTPVIRVYEQEARHARLLMEHYPSAGVGTPVGMRFTKGARCLWIRAVRKSGGHLAAVDYYLVLDLKRLLSVGSALEKDRRAETALEKDHRAEATFEKPLLKYNEAVTQQCYGK
jgi:hypothetical protein